MSSLKVAVAGTGYFSPFHLDAWQRIEGVRIVGIASLDGAAEAAARYGANGYDDVAAMLDAETPDLLDIVTPPATHLDLIRLAAERGVDAVCQKPFCGGLDGAVEAVEVADAAGIRLIVHENIRFQPWYAVIAERLADGSLGEPYGATFRLRPGDGQGADAYLARQPYFRSMERFLVHETLVHWIDTLRFLLEPTCGPVASVWADLRRVNEGIVGEDAGLVVLAFESGARGQIDGNRCADHAADPATGNRRLTFGELSVEGSKGELRLDGSARLTERDHGEDVWRDVAYDWDDIGFGADCVFRLQSRLVTALRDGAPFPNEARAYLRNLEIVEAVYRSSEEGRRMTL